MPLIPYSTKKPQKKSLDMILKIRDIVEEYQKQGYNLTVRQVYYQLVSRDIVPNSDKSYQEVGRWVKDGRMCGFIDWNAIVDRTRRVNTRPCWDGPKRLMEAAADQYHRDWWENQPYYLECWVEKEALAEVVADAAGRYDVPSFACKGYPSITTMRDAAERMIDRSGQQCTILYLGDHDPSGVNMVDNIKNQMETFSAYVTVERIALNIEQIEKYNPPPYPAKKEDRRYESYAAKFGTHSWELDALPPDVLANLITDNIVLRLDQELLAEVKALEEYERNEILRKVVNT